MSKWYAEIDETGFCFHATQTKLPLSDTILLVDNNVIGMVWDGENWTTPELETPETEPDPVMEKLNVMEEKLNALTSDSVTLENVETAILEGVNDV